jgi:hypothetical protein
MLNPKLATLHKRAEALGQKLDVDLSTGLLRRAAFALITRVFPRNLVIEARAADRRGRRIERGRDAASLRCYRRKIALYEAGDSKNGLRATTLVTR